MQTQGYAARWSYQGRGRKLKVDKIHGVAINTKQVMTEQSQTSEEMPDLQEALSATDLTSMQAVLRKQMASQRIQAAIKGDGLAAISNRILALAKQDSSVELLAGAALARLAAVARNREMEVFALMPSLFTVVPPSLETLSNGDDKAYAATSLQYCNGHWVMEYCLSEVLIIDTAEDARRELLACGLIEAGSLSSFLRQLELNSESIRHLQTNESRLKRTRRVLLAVFEVLTTWKGELGHEPGTALGSCLTALLRNDAAEADPEVLADVVDAALKILSRMIERRFSCAFDSTSYAVVERAKEGIGLGWHDFLSRSGTIAELRTHLLETALVLVRQNRSDSRIVEVIVLAFGSRPQAAKALKRRLADAQDSDPEVRMWWESAGAKEQGQLAIDHRFGNNEDQQIGSLLIEVESNKESMEKVSRAVVPLLEISDPVLASTVRSATAGYTEIAQTARRLARMRRLTKTDLKGERLEYNPLEHEMLGGHQPGVRLIRVVRDGVRKEFGGKVKTLVKPWVQPIE